MLVVGAGPIGQIHIQLAKLRGARIVIASDFSDERLAQARATGADVLINPARDDCTAGPGDGATRAPRQRGRAAAGQLFRRSGERSAVYPAQFEPVDDKQLVVTGTTGSNMRQYRAAMNLVGAGRIHLAAIARTRLPLDQIEEGLARAQSGTEMRILIEPAW